MQQVDSDIFDLVWSLFEDNERRGDFQLKLQELDLEAIGNLLQITAEYIERESSNPIKFALLLLFKKGIIDFAISAYPLLEMKPFLNNLHPMECVYMILNTLPSDEDEESWLDDDLEKAYSIFEYLVKWINWKIVENGDLEYYETYFQDYSSLERKRVMSSIGGDLLAFIARKAKTKSVSLVMGSLAEIIPLLNVDHLVAYWIFYQKIEGPVSALMDATTEEQRCTFLLNYEYPVVVTPVIPGRLSFSGSPKKFKMNLEENWKVLSQGFCLEVGKRFIISPKEGESFLPYSCSLSNDLYDSNWGLKRFDTAELSMVVRILHFSQNSILSLLSSKHLKNKQELVIQTCLFQWAQGTQEIKYRGFAVMKHLQKEYVEKARKGIENSAHLKLISEFLDSIE